MRLFIALTLPDDARDLLSDLQDTLPEGRAVGIDTLHLTLAFLGEVPEPDLPAIHEALASVRGRAVALCFHGGDVLGGRHGRAVVLRAEGGPELHDLHDRIQSRLHGAGLVLPRRRFRPHVTLMRTRDRTVAGQALASLPPDRFGPWHCADFALFSSILHRDGARHEELARYALGPAAPAPDTGAAPSIKD